jgi:hypothetical protein
VEETAQKELQSFLKHLEDNSFREHLFGGCSVSRYDAGDVYFYHIATPPELNFRDSHYWEPYTQAVWEAHNHSDGLAKQYGQSGKIRDRYLAMSGNAGVDIPMEPVGALGVLDEKTATGLLTAIKSYLQRGEELVKLRHELHGVTGDYFSNSFVRAADGAEQAVLIASAFPKTPEGMNKGLNNLNALLPVPWFERGKTISGEDVLYITGENARKMIDLLEQQSSAQTREDFKNARNAAWVDMGRSPPSR